MARIKRRKNYKQTCEEVLDKRNTFFEKLLKFETQFGYIPTEFKDREPQYKEWKEKGSWRNNKKLVKNIERRSKK